ncbi:MULTISPECIES: hypothetical protein [unclassified Exiguobacterium]|uniref:hypothetical protein n=1 Tax=unclassified Exiguobacterium TaxID=2644629 RepID=UPI001BEBF97C|nr:MULTISPECIES: hypothetical protein [unclassified Exiguobacterium]
MHLNDRLPVCVLLRIGNLGEEGKPILSFSNVSTLSKKNIRNITNLNFEFVKSSLVIGECDDELDLLISLLTGTQKLSSGKIEGNINKLPSVIDLRNMSLFKNMNGKKISKIFKIDSKLKNDLESFSQKYSTDFQRLSGYEKFELLCDLAVKDGAEVICFINPENHLNYKEIDKFLRLLDKINEKQCEILLFTTKEIWNEKLNSFDCFYFSEGILNRERR